MDKYLLSFELNAAAMKQCINARQVFTAYEAALKYGWQSVDGLKKAIRKHELLNAELGVGNVDLKTFELLQRKETANRIVIGEHSLYAYEANAGIQLKRDWEQTNLETVKEYPYIPYQAVVVAIDGRMARMRTMQPHDYVNAGCPLADMVQRMISDNRIYANYSESENE